MADVPLYRPSVGVQTPGTPDVRIDPMTPASAPTNVAEAAAGIGKTVEGIGSQLEQHMVMMSKIEAQQKGYDAAAKYSQALQQVVSNEKQKTGMDAKGAQQRLQEIVNGKPAVAAIPGNIGGFGRSKPAVAPLRDQFSQGLGALALKSFDRTADAHETTANGVLINHEVTQVNKAMEQNSTATIGTQIDAGNNIHYPTELKTAQQQFAKIIDNDQWLKSQNTPEALDRMKSGFMDKQVQAAVVARAPESYEKAQSLLDAATVSPPMRTHLQNDIINGARTDQYTEALTKNTINDPSLRAPNGEIDEAKATAAIQKNIAEQEASANPLPPGHADAMMGKIQSNIVIHNKGIAQKQQLVIAGASNDIYSAQQSGMSAQDAYTKFIKQGKFDNGIERGKAEDVFTKVYEKDPSALDTVWSHMSEAQKSTVNKITKSKDYLSKFPYPQDQKEFEDAFKQKILEGRVQSPDAINKLFQEQLEQTPSGDVGFFGGAKSKPTYQIDESLQKNQPLVKAVGGLSAAAALARGLGGPDRLAPDTNESKAVMAMKEDGYNMLALNSKQVQLYMKKYPDRLK